MMLTCTIRLPLILNTTPTTPTPTINKAILPNSTTITRLITNYAVANLKLPLGIIIKRTPKPTCNINMDAAVIVAVVKIEATSMLLWTDSMMMMSMDRRRSPLGSSADSWEEGGTSGPCSEGVCRSIITSNIDIQVLLRGVEVGIITSMQRMTTNKMTITTKK